MIDVAQQINASRRVGNRVLEAGEANTVTTTAAYTGIPLKNRA